MSERVNWPNRQSQRWPTCEFIHSYKRISMHLTETQIYVCICVCVRKGGGSFDFRAEIELLYGYVRAQMKPLNLLCAGWWVAGWVRVAETKVIGATLVHYDNCQSWQQQPAGQVSSVPASAQANKTCSYSNSNTAPLSRWVCYDAKTCTTFSWLFSIINQPYPTHPEI